MTIFALGLKLNLNLTLSPGDPRSGQRGEEARKLTALTSDITTLLQEKTDHNKYLFN